MSYVIRSNEEFDDETHNPLYWSNDDGWVSYETATIFPDMEGELPMGNCTWEVR